MNILILDDDTVRMAYFLKYLTKKYPDSNHKYVYSYNEFVEAVKEQPFDLMYLDHDLGAGSIVEENGIWYELCGADVAKYIVEKLPKELWPMHVTIHSWNPYGATRMYQTLYSAGISVRRTPFTTQGNDL